MEHNDFDNQFSQELTKIVFEKSKNYLSVKQPMIMPRDVITTIFSQENSSLINHIIERFKIKKEDLLSEIQKVDIPLAKKRVKKDLVLDDSTFYLLKHSDKIVSRFGHNFIDVEHVIFSFLSYKGKSHHITCVQNVLLKFGISLKEFRKEFLMIDENDNMGGSESIDDIIKTAAAKPAVPGTSTENMAKFEKMKVNLISYGYIEDIVEKVKTSTEKFFGREKELQRCIQILCRKKKRNAIIVGEPGTGKTALVDGLAKCIIDGRVPDRFKNAEIYSLNLGNMVAGTKYRGQFEERMKIIVGFIDTAKSLEKNMIVFIDEIHTLVTAGSAEGAVNASNVLKPKLSSSDMLCIGTTTYNDYKKHFIKDEALARRFSTIFLEEPCVDEVIDILQNSRDEYQTYHNVEISDAMIMDVVNLSDRYMKDRFFPDKAFDVLDEVCSRCVTNRKKKTDKETLDEVVSEATGIPITSVSGKEKQLLADMEKTLKGRVIGQDNAIKQVSNSVKSARIGLKDENKPIGVFLFLGPTGCGKTLLAKTLSEKLFGKDKLIRLDMSEYMDKIAVTKVTGSSPGYVGYEEGSVFADKIRKKPYSVILLDEIEKAHKDVLNVFLQIFDEGRMTDSLGRTTDFRNTIIIMTSNLATNKISKSKTVGFSNNGTVEKQLEIEEFLIKEVEKYFSPEFINRIDSTVIFSNIKKSDTRKIFDLEFSNTETRINKIGYYVELDISAIDFLCEKGYSEKYGARPMARTIQQFVEVPLTSKIIDDDPKKGSIVSIKRDGETLDISFKCAKK